MKSKPGKKTRIIKMISFDQQIKDCEEKIARLEEDRRRTEKRPEHLDRSINEQYEQVALLRIRKMMDY
jgi:hypothetical protein